MKNRFSKILKNMGILFIIGALSLCAYNVFDTFRGYIAQKEILEAYGKKIDKSKEGKIKDYLLNPDMEMPEVQLNGLSCVGTIEIPALDLKLPVTSEWSYDLMKQAPCRYYGSIYQKNMVIAAHNSWFHFGRLSHLKEGQKVIFTDAKEHRFIYRVKVVEALSPDCVEEVTNGKYPLTLFTCTLDAKNRVVVRCA